MTRFKTLSRSGAAIIARRPRFEALAELDESEISAIASRWAKTRWIVMAPLILAAGAPLWALLALLGLAPDAGVHHGKLSALLALSSVGVEVLILGAVAYFYSRQAPLKTLAESDDQTRAEALGLVKSSPEARKVAERAKKKGRALRFFDLLLMRERAAAEKIARVDQELSRIDSQLDRSRKKSLHAREGDLQKSRAPRPSGVNAPSDKH